MEKSADEIVNTLKEEITAFAMDENFLALGTNLGYKIYSMVPIKLIKIKDLGGCIGEIGFYNSDKIIWYVGGGSSPAAPDNELRLWNNHKDEQLLKIVLEKGIKKVLTKPGKILISLINKVYLYNVPITSDVIKFDTVDNFYGTIAMSQNEDTNLIAFLSTEI